MEAQARRIRAVIGLSVPGMPGVLTAGSIPSEECPIERLRNGSVPGATYRSLIQAGRALLLAPSGTRRRIEQDRGV
jgi:hypothetical protein